MPGIRVRLASLLHSYTGGRKVIELEAATVGEALSSLDEQFPGLMFRIVDEQGHIRPHMNVFVNEDRAHDLAAPLPRNAEIYIVGALSGG
jgi:sulfur-carrier protein